MTIGKEPLHCKLEIDGRMVEQVSEFNYEGKVKSSRPSLRETREKRPLGMESDWSWCHRHTTSMITLLLSQPMAPWAWAAAYWQGEKLLA